MIFLLLQLLPFSMRYPEAEQRVAWRAATSLLRGRRIGSAELWSNPHINV